jgi:SAM-dependent methyltransferase
VSDQINMATSSPSFFEAKYQKNPDPWNFSRSAYELGRYDAIVAALNYRRYRHAFEPGCSIGILTERLAQLCDGVLAIDFTPTAAASAAARCAHLKQVEIRCGSITDSIAGYKFDLLVLSEIGYYFKPEEWRRIATTLIDAVPAGGTVLAAHWLGHSEDHCISGDVVHEILRSNPQLHLEHEERNEFLWLDRWERL